VVRNFILLPLVLLLAQKPVEKPKVHADFQFGSYPSSRSAEEILKDDLARQLLVAFHEGWSLDKFAKTMKLPISAVSGMADKLEDAALMSRQDDFDIRPAMPVIRERDYDRVKDNLRRHTQEFTKLILDNWKDIETMVGSLEGAKAMPRDRVMYETIVSGILLGGVMDALLDDKTLLPGIRRRVKTDRYYAWLVESNPAAAGKLRREVRESAGYRIITIGTALADEKLNPDDLRGKATVLDDPDAQRYRTFISLLSRDKLLPYFKNRRDEFLKTGALISAGRYSAFAEFFAWYYNSIANGVTDALVAERRIAPPEKLYTYAVKVPQ
jgi:hypothetical protein